MGIMFVLVVRYTVRMICASNDSVVGVFKFWSGGVVIHLLNRMYFVLKYPHSGHGLSVVGMCFQIRVRHGERFPV